jgi:hypothetical protein
MLQLFAVVKLRVCFGWGLVLALQVLCLWQAMQESVCWGCRRGGALNATWQAQVALLLLAVGPACQLLLLLLLQLKAALVGCCCTCWGAVLVCPAHRQQCEEMHGCLLR